MLPTILVKAELDNFITTYKNNVAAEARALLIAYYVNTPEFAKSFTELQNALLQDRLRHMKMAEEAPKPPPKLKAVKGANAA